MKNEWRNPAILLASLGLGNIGNFIYLVTINILVFDMTGSATAVATLWLIGPLTNIVMKLWTGSYIDFRSKRHIMIQTYIVRGLFIMMLPFVSHVALIYVILVILNMANAFFGPSSTTYITLTISKSMRKQFNSIRSFTSSSAFIIGPSIGGGLILLTSIQSTLWINGLFFIIAALLLLLIPNNENIDKSTIPKLTLSQVKQDFVVVKQFMAVHKYIAIVYLGFVFVMVATFAMDAQEVVFAQQVIGLSEVEYSWLVSITGIGSVVGGLILSIFSKHFSIRFMISIGIVMASVGYVIYAFSWSFASITIGFMLLGFFLVFLNAGISTFYQNNVQTDLMGRVTSIIQLIQSALQVILILLVGLLGDLISLRVTIIGLSSLMLISALFYVYLVFQPKYKKFYAEDEQL
ncbi:MFS transporter [Aquisalibacillus elongatus]|uniref:MFS transporter n=1 Tax=Aquisalibacillus elongatus TaxID=485577 RepID=A0A3N5C5I0_9BACI|nr:MFS transporter [Aquisalibacillus elongatus]RPF53455.1 MFS transporter [Aquisalibacillus elongatus]